MTKQQNCEKFAYQFDRRFRPRRSDSAMMSSLLPSGAPAEQTLAGSISAEIYEAGRKILSENEVYDDAELMNEMGIALSAEELRDFLKGRF